MKESEGTEEITSFALYPYLLQGQQALPDLSLRVPLIIRWIFNFVFSVILENQRAQCSNRSNIYYSKFAKDHFFDVRYFVHIITIYNQIATKGKSIFGSHKLVMQLLI